mmetsp:Transcript_51801/g.110819  ORF Transcript_51801/g.110819 Transcript_51801/m.110819 type:complete len:296 (-) Transcript_51801:197-1084(-)
MHKVGVHIFQEALEVCHYKKRALHVHASCLGDGIRDVLQRVDIQAGVYLVKDSQPRPQDGQLKHLVPLPLATTKALVNVAVEEVCTDLQLLQLLRDVAIEFDDVQLLFLSGPPLGIVGGAEEVEVADTTHCWRTLEGEEETRQRALVGLQVEEALLIEGSLARGDLVAPVADEHLGECALPRAVGTHDRMHLALADGKVQPFEDLLPGLVNTPSLHALHLKHDWRRFSRWRGCTLHLHTERPRRYAPPRVPPCHHCYCSGESGRCSAAARTPASVGSICWHAITASALSSKCVCP